MFETSGSIGVFLRLNILELTLPPLRKRPEDIPVLISQFIEGICGAQRALDARVSPEVLAIFRRYPWPGNVRELKNVLACAYCCMDDDRRELTPGYLPDRLRAARSAGSARKGPAGSA